MSAMPGIRSRVCRVPSDPPNLRHVLRNRESHRRNDPMENPWVYPEIAATDRQTWTQGSRQTARHRPIQPLQDGTRMHLPATAGISTERSCPGTKASAIRLRYLIKSPAGVRCQRLLVQPLLPEITNKLRKCQLDTQHQSPMESPSSNTPWDAPAHSGRSSR